MVSPRQSDVAVIRCYYLMQCSLVACEYAFKMTNYREQANGLKLGRSQVVHKLMQHVGMYTLQGSCQSFSIVCRIYCAGRGHVRTAKGSRTTSHPCGMSRPSRYVGSLPPCRLERETKGLVPQTKLKRQC